MKVFSAQFLYTLIILPAPVFSFPPWIIPESEVPPIPPVIAVAKYGNPIVTSCLSNSTIEHVLPSSPKYASLSRSYNLRFDYKPAAIAYPKTPEEVQQIVKCAISKDIKLSIRGGGHSYGAFAFGGEDGRLMIDMERFQTISYDESTEIATVGAGVRLGNLASKLLGHGRAIPHGACANVGVSGLALHGGYGMASRLWGLTLDVITEIRGVTADGELFVANESENEELFWALRGAGSAFGIATEFKFKTFPAPETLIAWRYDFQFRNAEDAARAFMEFQAFGREKAPAKLSIQIEVTENNIGILGNFFGPREEYDDVIHELYDILTMVYGGEPKVEIREQTWHENLVRMNGGPILTPTVGFNQFDSFYAKSLVVPDGDDLTYETALSLFKFVFDTRGSAPHYFFQINLYGGKNSQIAAVSADETAYADRDALLNFQFYAYIDRDDVFTPDIITFIQDMDNSITSIQNPRNGELWPAYANYIDPTLTNEEAGPRYYGHNLERLRQLKEKYDPERRLGVGLGI
ncbi:FAD-binding domain-containing protein [Ascobolus immersus RN42]|uniref:FAD-binding domain-containing protein n=1 Tax=Ascobolus immersus RN42 TaxID=1160509 RepID=A0A3N4HP71_ASCIM|nr:FAD-binding domain-containing protein [Ascobolus immersus RN42]